MKCDLKVLLVFTAQVLLDAIDDADLLAQYQQEEKDGYLNNGLNSAILCKVGRGQACIAIAIRAMAQSTQSVFTYALFTWPASGWSRSKCDMEYYQCDT